MLKKLLVIQILTMTVMVAVHLFAPPAFAGLYKWVDDQGKVHFTDDKGKIPKKYRTDTQMKRLHSIAGPKETPSTGSSKGSKGGGGTDEASVSAEDTEGILEEVEEKAVAEVIAFFQKENDRAAGFDGLPNNYANYQTMNSGFKNFLPVKKGFLQKFSKSKVPALKETHSYLKNSIEEDQAQIATLFQSGLSRGYFKRIVSEIALKEQLTKKLKAAVEESKKKKEELKKAEEEMKQAEAEKEKKKETAKK